jgi:branched-chain amino acid aminotransferase
MGELSKHCWHNGELLECGAVAPSIASISFHMGTGVFDGLMAYWNGDHYYLHEAAAHFDRLIVGAEHMGLPIPWTTEQMVEGVRQMLALETPRTYYVRPIVYRGGPELWLTGAEGRPVDLSIFGVPVQRGVRTPVSCEISPIERVSSRAMPVRWKVCGLYVNSFLARRQAERSGVRDGLMLDREGRIAEMSAANVFFIHRDGLLTPPLSEDVFPGITRQVIFGLCDRLGIACRERNLFPADLPGFEGAFLSSTLMEVRPIPSIGGVAYQSSEHAIFNEICTAFDRLTAQ